MLFALRMAKREKIMYEEIQKGIELKFKEGMRARIERISPSDANQNKRSPGYMRM